MANRKNDQRDLHIAAIKHLVAIEHVIDKLKTAGAHPLDGSNALENVRERLSDLARR